jgi:hypothetical protein
MTPETELLILALRGLNGFLSYTQNRNITGAQVAAMFDKAKAEGREITEIDFVTVRDNLIASTDKIRNP